MYCRAPLPKVTKVSSPSSGDVTAESAVETELLVPCPPPTSVDEELVD